MKLLSAFLFALIAFTGCSSHVDFSSPYNLEAQDRIAIAIDPTLVNKVESSSVVWEQGTYALGPALARVIDNRSDAPSRIEYVSSNLVITQSVSWFLSGTMIADYTLLVKRNVGGSSSLVEARGKAISYWSSFNAGQEAIEKAMLDLITKLKALN
jgi:hypothetical protein